MGSEDWAVKGVPAWGTALWKPVWGSERCIDMGPFSATRRTRSGIGRGWSWQVAPSGRPLGSMDSVDVWAPQPRREGPAQDLFVLRLVQSAHRRTEGAGGRGGGCRERRCPQPSGTAGLTLSTSRL